MYKNNTDVTIFQIDAYNSLNWNILSENAHTVIDWIEDDNGKKCRTISFIIEIEFHKSPLYRF